MSKQELQDMLQNAVHFGHRTSKWNPKMAPYIHGVRNGVHIINLQKTLEQLEAAINFLKVASSESREVLLVSTKQQATKHITDFAEKCGVHYINHKWIGGTLTNWKTIKQRIRHLRDLKQRRDSGEFEKYTKKEVSKLNKEITKLEERFGGLEKMDRLPQVLIMTDPVRDNTAVEEAIKMNIPIIALNDTNSSPDNIAYPIPANNNAIKSLEFFLGKFEKAILDGRKSKKQ